MVFKIRLMCLLASLLFHVAVENFALVLQQDTKVIGLKVGKGRDENESFRLSSMIRRCSCCASFAISTQHDEPSGTMWTNVRLEGALLINKYSRGQEGGMAWRHGAVFGRHS